MKSRTMSWLVCSAAVVVLVGVTGVVAQTPAPEHFSGIINDYTPASTSSGPWEMHGTWSLRLKGDSGKADFSVVMTMEHPDSWIAMNPGSPSNPNVNNPAARSPHTHHITMTDAIISSDTSVCAVDSPATTVRLVVIGQPSTTGNGSPAPFEAKGPSTLQVCITGGTEVEYSNMTLAFTNTSPAAGHFGTQAIHGVVRKAKPSDPDDKDRR